MATCKTATVSFRAGVRALLAELHSREVRVSLASPRNPTSAKSSCGCSTTMGTALCPQYGWQSKGEAVTDVMKAFRKHDEIELDPSQVLFVDDDRAHCDSVRRVGASSLLLGRDARSIPELLVVLGGS
ncbi:MAG: hypothetical protein AAF488_00575 [Planctomycetota bacterium]